MRSEALSVSLGGLGGGFRRRKRRLRSRSRLVPLQVVRYPRAVAAFVASTEFSTGKAAVVQVEGYELFSSLAEDYARYRPGYPPALLAGLERGCGLGADWVVADVGSGTGNLARLFLDRGCPVTAVEPNREMREAGERMLGGNPSFRSLEGTAERLPLEAGTVDLIAVGQALHWFDVPAAREEFLRVLRPGGWVAIAWNDRLPDATPFTREYDLLTSAWAERSEKQAPALTAGLSELFAAATPRQASFPHVQRFDLQGLLGRARSSGFVPQPGAAGNAERSAALTGLFERHQRAGVVEFRYEAQLRYERLATT